MSIILSQGWRDFSGGGTNLLCGEPQTPPECPEPPCDIPPGEIGKDGDLSCVDELLTVGLNMVGGVPPFVWTTDYGLIIVTGVRTANLVIDEAVPRPVSWGSAPKVDPISGLPVGCDDASDAAFVYAGIIRRISGGVCQYSCEYVAYNCHGNRTFGIGSGPTGGGTCSVFIDPTPECFDNCDPCIQDLLSVCPAPWPEACQAPTGGGAFCDELVPPVPIPHRCGIDVGGCPTPTGDNCQSAEISQHGQFCDVRHPNLLAAGCSPCELNEERDIIVTTTDAFGIATFQTVHLFV